MNRREFLGRSIVGAAAIVAAPSIISAISEQPKEDDIIYFEVNGKKYWYSQELERQQAKFERELELSFYERLNHRFYSNYPEIPAS